MPEEHKENAEVLNTEVNIGQDNILRKIHAYLKIQKSKDERLGTNIYQVDINQLMKSFDEGKCSGLGALYLFYKSKGQEDTFFFENLRLMDGWDESEEALEKNPSLQGVFEQAINDIRWLQAQDQIMSFALQQKNYPALFDVVKPKAKKTTMEGVAQKLPEQAIRMEYQLNFVFKEKELAFALEHIIKEKKMVRLGSFTHTVSVMLIEGKYYVYDSNEEEYSKKLKSNEKVFDSIADLVPHLRNILFERIHEKPADYSHMPLAINIYDHSDRPEGVYKYSPRELIEKFITENNEINRKNEIDNLDPMSIAILEHDLPAVAFLLSKGIKIPKDIKIFRPDNKSFFMHTLSHAARDNNLDFLKLMIDSDPDIIRTANGAAALSSAFSKGFFDSARYLKDKGAKLTPGSAKYAYLQYLSFFRDKNYKGKAFDLGIIDVLMADKSEILKELKPNENPVAVAIEVGDLEALNYLSRMGFQVEDQHYMKAFKAENLPVLLFLTQYNMDEVVDFLQRNARSRTSISSKTIKALQDLIAAFDAREKGLHEESKYFKEQFLNYLSVFDKFYKEAVEYENKIKMEVESQGIKAIAKAMVDEKFRYVKELMENNIKIDKENAKILYLEIMKECKEASNTSSDVYLEFFKILNKAKIDLRDFVKDLNVEDHPFNIAIDNRNLELLDFLFKKGVSIDKRHLLKILEKENSQAHSDSAMTYYYFKHSNMDLNLSDSEKEEFAETLLKAGGHILWQWLRKIPNVIDLDTFIQITISGKVKDLKSRIIQILQHQMPAAPVYYESFPEDLKKFVIERHNNFKNKLEEAYKQALEAEKSEQSKTLTFLQPSQKSVSVEPLSPEKEKQDYDSASKPKK